MMTDTELAAVDAEHKDWLTHEGRGAIHLRGPKYVAHGAEIASRFAYINGVYLGIRIAEARERNRAAL